MKGRSPLKRKQRSGSAQSKELGMIGASVFGVCVGIFMTVALAVLCSVICLMSGDPDKLMTPLCVLSLVAIYFFTGFFAAKKHPAAVPCGLIGGGTLAVIFLAVSCFFSDAYSQGLSLPVTVLIRLSFVAVSLVGALIAVNAGTKKKRRRR